MSLDQKSSQLLTFSTTRQNTFDLNRKKNDFFFIVKDMP